MTAKTYFLPLDISRCANENCKRKLKCARYLDRLPFDTYWFSYFDENNCKDYIKK